VKQEADELFRTAKAYFNNGEFFRCYDLAVEAFCQTPQEGRFAHLAVLSLANAGALELAVEKFVAFGLDRSEEQEARSLLGRLKKDEGFAAAGEERLRLHKEALAIYEEAYARALHSGNTEAYYPGINAAALALWTGDRATARTLARVVLEEVLSLLKESQRGDRYWLLATALEARLLLGESEAAGELALAVLAEGAGQHAQVASTGRQLRRIVESIEVDPAFVEVLRRFAPPAVIHFSGHIIAARDKPGRFPAHEEETVREKIRQVLEEEGVGSGYGSLAAGADILMAEALLERGASLNVVLPFAIEDFLVQSVQAAGEGWVTRFHACLKAARTVRYATEDSFMEDESLYNYCSQLGMGLAVLAARHMQAAVLQVAVWDGEARSGAAGTAVDLKAWREAGLPQRVIQCGVRAGLDGLETFQAPAARHTGTREIRAMLFADVHGFSKLNDRELSTFAASIMGPLAEVTAPYRPDLAFLNTWGDGIFAVLADVGKAAEWALRLQECMHGIDLKAAGLPEHLRLRIGGHLGPAYELMDPVLKRMNFYGAHVSRAARIEPVTPEGCVYVTETFAAVLALRCGDRFACDYVGYTEMAKHYGRLRMFLLRPLAGSAAPAVLGDIERTPLTS
jgi:hypothetical protein